MQTHWTIAAIASLMAVAQAQQPLIMSIGADQRFYQDSPLKVRFDSGELNMFLRDGIIVLADCATDPQLFFFGPNLVCPLGATGYIAEGDIDRNGTRDDNQYWSVASLQGAQLIETSRPDLVQLIAGPPSKLPRPLQNFRDDSVVTFYDVSSAAVRQYNQTRYEFVRRYGATRQIETAVALGTIMANGTLDVTVTAADVEGSPLLFNIPVEEFEGPDQWADKVRLALSASDALTAVYTVGGSGSNIVLTEQIADGNDPTLNISMGETALLSSGLPAPTSLDTLAGEGSTGGSPALQLMSDELVPGTYSFSFPRLDFPELTPVVINVTIVPYISPYGFGRRGRSGFRFTNGRWDGSYYQMDPRLITEVKWQGNSRNVIRPGDQIYFSILNEAEDFLLFPPTVPQNPILLTTPTVQKVTVPPSFFVVGDEGVINLRFQRFLPSSGVGYDLSQRVFRAKTRMVDSYTGFAQTSLPIGSTKRQIAPNSDIDGDSMSNLEEFAYQFPTNQDINASAKAQFVPAPVLDVFLLPGPYVEEFNRVVTQVNNPITDEEVQPDGPAAPFLDAENHLVFRVPYRPRVGNSLSYRVVEYVTNKKGKKKAKKIKNFAKLYDVNFETEASDISVIIEVKVVTAESREVVAIRQRDAMVDVDLTQQFMVVRSKEPVEDPDAALPDLGVVIKALDVN